MPPCPALPLPNTQPDGSPIGVSSPPFFLGRTGVFVSYTKGGVCYGSSAVIFFAAVFATPGDPLVTLAGGDSPQTVASVATMGGRIRVAPLTWGGHPRVNRMGFVGGGA